MKNIFIAALLAVSVLNVSAQKNCSIKTAYAFYTASMPGMAMADENGNTIPPKPIINRFIYIQWVGVSKPQINTVMYNNKVLIATLSKVEGNSIIPGGDIENNRNFKIGTKKGTSLWKIELQPPGEDPMPAQDCKNIIIKTKGKSCSVKLLKETLLATMPAY